MTDMTNEALKSLITSREEIAFNQANENLEYIEICKQQEKAEKKINKLYERFNAEELATIHKYYEDGNHKQSLELREMYFQGLKDCFKIIAFLCDFQCDVK